MRDVIRGRGRPVRARAHRGRGWIALRRLRGDERGAIGVIVCLLIGTVLLGLGALVIDVAQIYQERAELQNGADAAALAVAKSCAIGTCTPSLAGQYASENASSLTGGTEGVAQICGSGTLGTCPAGTGAITDCPAAPSSGLGYVDVYTSTQTSSGSTVIAPIFARELLGNSSYSGTTVKACAQASWGGASSANTLAFTLSACSWDSWTSQGTNFAPAPPAVPSSSYDHQLNLGNLGNGRGCTGETGGSDGAGAFGWAADQTGTCGIFTGTGTFPAATGASAGSTCQASMSSAQASRKAILLPVYSSFTGTGSNTVFTLKGFAAFVITGYSLPGFYASDWLNPFNNLCSYKCIDGYFTKALIPGTVGASGGGTYLGATVIGLSG